MYIVSPTYLFLSNGFVTKHSFVYDKEILWVGKSSELPKQYKNIKRLKLPTYSCVTPGFINSHVHLEFSANKTSLKYGRFLPWLYSIIKERDALISSCNEDCIKDNIEKMIQTGTTAFAAISSFGTEMKACINSPAKVIFFSELIGSTASMVDTLWSDFLSKVNDSKRYKSDTFTPAIAVHSAYSVHPILVKKAIVLAKNDSLLLTAHLLESDAERNWLEFNKGEFAPFFKDFLKQTKAVTSIDEFISSFNNSATLFAHATKLTNKEFKYLNKKNHTIIHCPVSNRLLGNGVLNFENLYKNKIDYICGTDGLSSNYSLDILQELKAAIFMHSSANLDTLSLSLLHSITTVAGRSLNLNSGRLETGLDADFLIFNLEKEVLHVENLALHIIFKNYQLQAVYIDGINQKENHENH